MSEQTRILVDTDVWVGNYLGTSPHYEESYAFLKLACERGATLLYGATKLEDAFSELEAGFVRAMWDGGAEEARAKSVARSFAWGCVDNIRELGTAVGADEADLWLACKYRTVTGNLADGMVLASAKRAKADYLVTWNEQLLSSGLVSAATPPQMMTILELDA